MTLWHHGKNSYALLGLLSFYTPIQGGKSWSWSYGSWIYNYLCNQCLSPPSLWFRILLMASVLDTTLCDKVCQWLATGLWFSPSTPVSSTNKADRHDIAEILLKVALNTTHLNIKTFLANSQLITCIYWPFEPVIVLSMFMLSFIFW